jgi:hypothetical protein
MLCRFRGAYCSHHQSLIALMMDAISTSEMSLSFCSLQIWNWFHTCDKVLPINDFSNILVSDFPCLKDNEQVAKRNIGL